METGRTPVSTVVIAGASIGGLERDGTDLGAAGVRQPLPWGQATG